MLSYRKNNNKIAHGCVYALDIVGFNCGNNSFNIMAFGGEGEKTCRLTNGEYCFRQTKQPGQGEIEDVFNLQRVELRDTRAALR